MPFIAYLILKYSGFFCCEFCGEACLIVSGIASYHRTDRRVGQFKPLLLLALTRALRLGTCTKLHKPLLWASFEGKVPEVSLHGNCRWWHGPTCVRPQYFYNYFLRTNPRFKTHGQSHPNSKTVVPMAHKMVMNHWKNTFNIPFQRVLLQCHCVSTLSICPNSVLKSP